MLISWTVRNPGRFSHAIEKASLEAKRGRQDQAFRSIQELITTVLRMGEHQIQERALGPCISEAYSAQADIRRQQRNEDSAVELLLQARQFSSLSPQILSFLASRLASQHQEDDTAWEVFLDYCKGNPADADDPVLQHLRNNYEVTPDIPPAHLEHLQQRNRAICETGCFLPWSLFSVAYIAATEWKDNAPLEKCADTLRERGLDSDLQARFYLARCLTGLNRCEEALALFHTLDPALNSWWVYHFALATAHFRLNNIEEAKREFKKAEEVQGDSVGVVQLHLGHLAFQAAELASAEEYYSTACEGPHDDWWGAYWLGRTKLLSRRLEEARQFFQRAATLSSASTPLIAMAVAHEMSGEWGSAISLYDQCLSRSPDLAVAILRKGICLAIEGNTAEARKCFTQARSKESTGDAARFYLGILSVYEDAIHRAAEEWEAIQSEPWASYVGPRLAIVRRRQAEADFDEERYTEAINAWTKSLPFLEEEEKATVERNIAEAKFHKACSFHEGSDRLEAIWQVIDMDDSARGRYYSFLRWLVQDRPENCDFLGLVGSEGLDADRCKYHHAVARRKQGFFEEELLSELVQSSNKYSLPARGVLVSGYISSGRISEALSALAEMLS